MAQHQAPERVNAQSIDDYLEAMSRSVFSTGMSYRMVDSKWPEIREAMWDFDTKRIAYSTPEDIDRLAQDRRVVRNRRKLEAIVSNARRMIELEERHGSLRTYLRSFGDFEATVKDIRKQFKFLGEMGCYHFLYVVGEYVPPYEEWRRSHT